MTETETETDNDFKITKDVSNNLGDLFNQARADTIQGTKLQQKEAIAKQGRDVLKNFKRTHNLAEAREHFTKFLEVFYSGKDLDTQLIKLNKQTDPDEILQIAWNILLSREETIKKIKAEVDEILS